MVEIKKYSNRRLYNSTAGRYVNLEGVAELVRSGEEVRVTEAKSGDDITPVILTQIIVEEAKNRESALPTDFLRQLVMASGRAQQEFMTKYFNFVFEIYQKAQGEVRERLHNPRLLNPDVASAIWPWPAIRERAAAFIRDESNQNGKTDAAAELAALRQRLEELEHRLTKDGHA